MNDEEFEKSKAEIVEKYGEKLGKMLEKGLELEKNKRYNNLEEVLIESKKLK